MFKILVAYDVKMMNSPRVAALVLARSGSSLSVKNIRNVAGHPLLSWPISAAMRSPMIDEVYLSSDSERYLSVGRTYGAVGVLRPKVLSGDAALGCDVVRHGIRVILQKSPSVDTVVVLHGNSVASTTDQIDESLSHLADDSTISAVIPAEIEMDRHPFRAKRLNSDGSVNNFFPLPSSTSSNRQDLPTAVFYLHNFWTVRVQSALDSVGEPPWPCHGPNVKALLTNSAVPDVHTVEDLELSERWILRNGIEPPKALHTNAMEDVSRAVIWSSEEY